MSLAVVDLLGSSFDSDVIPMSPNLILIYSEKNSESSIINHIYQLTTDIEMALQGGIFSMSVSNEVQRGVLLSRIFLKKPSVVVYTSRPEILSKYMPGILVEVLKSPLKSIRAVVEEKPRALQPSPKKEVDYFDIVYQESLKKYLETMLFSSLRANKQKSAKAQVKNLVVGIIASLKKKTSADFVVDSEEITESMFRDFEDHDIITSGPMIDYNDEAIEAYFGRKKTRVFNPNYKSGFQNVKKEQEREKEPICTLDEAIREIAGLLLENDGLKACTSIGHLLIFCKKILKSYQEDSGKNFSDRQISEITSRLLTFAFENCFLLPSSVSIEAVSKEPQNFFTIKIENR